MASSAYQDFDLTLRMVDALIILEANYVIPLSSEQQILVEGLRGGAAVLMVAAFENFLKSMVEEYLEEFSYDPIKFNLLHIPDAMRLHNIEQILHQAEQNGKGQDKATKLTGHLQASKEIMSGRIIIDGFSTGARNNPNPERIKELFANFGINNFFSDIKVEFETAWGGFVAPTFIQDTLKNIVDRRHVVAHTANVLTITKTDLENSVRFLRVFGGICDKKLQDHIATLLAP